MLLKIFIQIISFSLTLVVHFFYSTWSIVSTAKELVKDVEVGYLATYLGGAYQVKGISYSLAAAFITYLTMKLLENPAKNLRGVLKGTTAAIIIFLLGYFLLGSYDSFVREFYISKIGWVFVPIAERITVLTAAISISIGYILTYRKTRTRLTEAETK